MVCSVQDLREREIINLKDGARLGSVCDVEIDTLSGSIVSIVIYGKGRFPFKSGKPKDIKIKWDEIEVIGDDTILVNFDCPEELMPQKPKNPIAGAVAVVAGSSLTAGAKTGDYKQITETGKKFVANIKAARAEMSK